MNGWRALQEILVLAMVHTGSYKTRTIGKGGEKLKCKGKGQYLKGRRRTKRTQSECRPAGPVCGVLQEKLQNWKNVPFTQVGPQATWGAFNTGTSLHRNLGLFCGSPGLQERHSHRHTYEQTHRPTSGASSHHSQWLLSKKLQNLQIHKTAVSLWENRSDLVEIFT